ncbi:aldolase [Microbulbifer thermotolerans]|nr:aldolase [Microbulbifer thermotolerans]MCX2778273.1 aldolase [Microbulbifer thermotolerans]MCX2796290.1 aldolase [Microbulbifer thermotolerans]MCX2804312.1 aldolase [Microbulbifer thermotolerans]MCX2832117.1 aldolase [Microbulbifer thermotolerans]WKT60911.1 aldolase [Microbulbifer thermotolerans]
MSAEKITGETLSLNKCELVRRAQDAMHRHLDIPDWSLREKVALTCRILFSQGHDSGLAGQITARAEVPEAYYTQRLGLGFDEITASNLLMVDEDLEVLSGEGMANPANRFHSWIYRARPDVQCIVHTHPLHISALSMLGRPLEIAHMDTCPLYGEVAFLAEWPGVPVGNSEGEIIASALGDKRAALLAHHGLVLACRSVEEACVLAIQCERAARLQLLAESAGRVRDIDPQLAREAHDWVLHEKRTGATFAYYARRALRAIGPDEIHPLT